MEQTQVSQQNCIIQQSHVECAHRSSSPNYGYSYYLVEQGFSFNYADPYLITGAFNEIDTCMIHITVVRQQFGQLIRPLLAFLKPITVSFAIPVNADHHSSILDGRSCFPLTGKVLPIKLKAYENSQDCYSRVFYSISLLCTKPIVFLNVAIVIVVKLRALTMIIFGDL